MQESTKKKLSIILSVLALLLLGKQMLTSLMTEEGNYSILHEESFTKQTISQAFLTDDILYVCYDDPPIVNAYTSDGTFLWCVQTPSLRNAQFEVVDGQLVIYNYHDSPAYLYDAHSGVFQDCVMANTLELSYDFGDEPGDLDSLTVGQLSWDSFNVYRMTDQGVATIVSRPKSYYLSHPTLTWAILFFGGMIIFFVRAFREVREKEEQGMREMSKDSRRDAVFIRVSTLILSINIGLNILIIPFKSGYFLISFGLSGIAILSRVVFHGISIASAAIQRTLIFKAHEEEHPYVQKWNLFWFLAVFLNVFTGVGMLMLTQ